VVSLPCCFNGPGGDENSESGQRQQVPKRVSNNIIDKYWQLGLIKGS